MRVEEGERLLAEPQRVRVAAQMRPRQRQQHAGVVVGILKGIGDAAVDIQRAHPAALGGTPVAPHELQTMRDQPVRRPVPAALLGDGESIDLPRHGAHALRLRKRRAVEAQRLVEAAMHLVDALGRPQRQRFVEQPVMHPAAPGAADQHPVGRRREARLQPTALLKLLDDLLDVLAVADRCDEGRVGCRDDRHVLQSDRRQKAAVAAEVRVLAVDRDHVADDHVALTVRRTDIEQRLP